MPIEHRPRFFDELVSSSLLVLEQSSALVLDVHNPENAALFIQLGDEIRLLSGLAKAFSTSTSQTLPAASAVSVAPTAPAHIISSVRKGWGSIVHSAVHLSTEEVKCRLQVECYRVQGTSTQPLFLLSLIACCNLAEIVL